MSRREELLLKQAFALGVIRAGRDSGLEKEAFTQYLSNAWKLGRGVLGKALGAGRMLTYGGGPMAEALVKRLPVGSFGRRMFQDALQYGALGGTINLATGDSNIPWYERYARGMVTGGLGGAAFRAGIGGTRKLMGAIGKSRWLGSRAPGFAKRMVDFGAEKPDVSRIGNIIRYARSAPGTVGETAKRLGMYTLGGIPLLTAGFGASMLGEDLGNKLIGKGIFPNEKAVGILGPPVGIMARRALPTAKAFFGLSPTGTPYAY